jgi:ubiquinone/menaquinone biosynthesis C-methylase UbiE
MDADTINKQYWSTVESEKILAGLCFPAEELTEHLEIKSNVLDVGCGSGKLSEYLNEKGYAVTGIDINKKALEENRERNSNITYIEADITKNLPFTDSQFDGVVVSYVFVSIIDRLKQKAAADELVRVLKKGGILWICEATYSEDYDERYKVGKEMTGLDKVALSFSKNLDHAKEIERVIKHYSHLEIDELFSSLEKISSKQISVISPNSGMAVNTIVTVYKKS